MYNEEFKMEYIAYHRQSNMTIENYLTCQFNKTEKTEKVLGKDLYNFTVREIIDYYKSLYSATLETLMVMNSQFKNYTRYALQQNRVIDCQNHYEELDQNILIQCINTGLAHEKIMTRQQILTYNFQNAFEQFLMLAMFEGICGKNYCEIAQMTMENFLPNGKVKLCSGRVLAVSKELVSIAQQAAEEYEYIPYNADGSAGEPKKYKEGDDRIVKDMYNVHYASNDDEYVAQRNRIKIYNRMCRIKDSYGIIGASSKALNESGRIAMIKEYMEKYGISAKDVLTIYKNDIEYRYGTIASMNRYLLKYKRYLEGK